MVSDDLDLAADGLPGSEVMFPNHSSGMQLLMLRRAKMPNLLDGTIALFESYAPFFRLNRS
jgi:hypothetical protein